MRHCATSPAVALRLLALLGLLLSSGAFAAAGPIVLVPEGRELTLGLKGEQTWTVEPPEAGRPPADPERVRDKMSLSADNPDDVYPALGGAAQLVLKARVDSPKLKGAGTMLWIGVNGRPLTERDLVGRPPAIETPSGKQMPLSKKGVIFNVFAAPDFSPLPESYKYYPLNLLDHDPYTFRFNLSRLMKPGENEIVIRNARPERKYSSPMIVTDARIETPLLDDALLERAAEQKAEAGKMRGVLESLYARLPVVTDTPETRRTLESFRMTNWGASNAGPMTEYNDPKRAAENARRIELDGATIGIIRGRHFRLDHWRENDRLLDFYETCAKALHDEGLKAFAHFDYTVFFGGAYPIVRDHTDWLQQSLLDGTPHHWCCVNNPDFAEAHIRYVEEIVRRGVEGFMLDEIGFVTKGHLHCGCEHCRRLFEAETGLRLPETNDRDVIDNRNSPVWRLWLQWQSTRLTRFKAAMLERLRKIDPNVVILTYCTNIYNPSDAHGNTYEEGRVCMIGMEQNNVVYGGYANAYAQMRVSAAFARRWGRPSWSQYSISDSEQRPFVSAWFAPVSGCYPWGWRRWHMDESMREEMNWPGLDESFAFAEPVADVAVLLSTANRWGPHLPGTTHAQETYGWGQAFGLRGVQFDYLPSLHTGDADMRKYRALIVSHAVAMPKAAVERVKRYVADGGTVVLTGVCGRYDEMGYPLGAESLFRDAGIRAVEARDGVTYDRGQRTFSGIGERELTLRDGALAGLPRTLETPPTHRFDAILAPGAKGDALATFADGAPAIVSLPRGKGRYLYVGFLPGQAIFQRHLATNYETIPCLDPATMDLMRAVAREATGGADAVDVEGERILSSTWRKGTTTWTRIVNIGGAALSLRATHRDLEVRYPDLGPIRVRVRAPVAPTATLVSPDLDEPMNIERKPAPGGAGGVFEIPAGAFRRFAFLRMEDSQ